MFHDPASEGTNPRTEPQKPSTGEPPREFGPSLRGASLDAVLLRRESHHERTIKHLYKRNSFLRDQVTLRKGNQRWKLKFQEERERVSLLEDELAVRTDAALDALGE